MLFNYTDVIYPSSYRVNLFPKQWKEISNTVAETYKVSEKVANKYKEAQLEQMLEALKFQRKALDDKIMNVEMQLFEVTEKQDQQPKQQESASDQT